MSRLGPDAIPATAASTMLHWVDGAWTGLRFSPSESGIEILDAVRLQQHELRAWLGEAPGVIRVVLPASSSLARPVDLGSGDEAALDDRLQRALTDRLGDSAPAHRLAAAVLPGAPGGSRHGVLIGWPLQRTIDLPSDPESTLAVPDTVALLAALDGGTPDTPLLWHDPTDGSTSLVLTDGNRLAVRSTQAPNLNQPEGLRRFVLESGLQAGWTPNEAGRLADSVADIAVEGACMHLPPTLAQRFRSKWTGSCPDGSVFQVAIGCALATVDDLAPLTLLRAEVPEYEPTFMERWSDRLSSRRIASKLAVALVLLFLLGPIVFSGIRLGLLKLSHGSIEDAVRTASVAEQRNKMYAQLGTGSLPVTKILADITAATPLGISIDSIRMGAGEPLRIAGAATNVSDRTAAELIGSLKAHMQASRVFREVTVEWGGQSNLGAREFTVSAQIAAAALRPKYPVEQDFAAWTHQQRDHRLPNTAEGGPPARPSLAARWDPNAAVDRAAAETPGTPAASPGSARATPGGSSAQPADASPATATATTPPSPTPPATPPTRTTTLGGGSRPDRGGGSLSASDTGSESLAGAGARSGDLSAEDMGAIPEILTPEQIATLSKDEALNRVKEVSAARKHISDPEMQTALRAYSKQLFDHLHARDSGSGTP